ncbi:MAG: hypothetical protein CMJ19_15795 [Phycisphaeraceae bacterium]|nr:hypothetical protein [Phycisphaeraceae bacterium]
MQQLTEEEFKVLQDHQFLLTKQEVSNKIISYLAEIERKVHQQIEVMDFDFPSRAFLRSGKISKGENYKSLPYYILDYPRMFSKTDVFAFRSMLWWGQSYNCTLHLSGQPLERARKQLIERLEKEHNIYFCVHPNPWEYHYEQSNYKLVTDLNKNEIIHHIDQHHFIKISRKIPLEKWDYFSDFTLKSLNLFLNFIR